MHLENGLSIFIADHCPVIPSDKPLIDEKNIRIVPAFSSSGPWKHLLGKDRAPGHRGHSPKPFEWKGQEGPGRFVGRPKPGLRIHLWGRYQGRSQLRYVQSMALCELPLGGLRSE